MQHFEKLSYLILQVPKDKKNQVFKKRISLDIEDAGFQEGDYLSEGDSESDTNESIINGPNVAEASSMAMKKRE